MDTTRTIRLGSAVLICEDDRILLGLRSKQPNAGRWVIPGGGVRFGESYVDAAKREAREELGVEVEIMALAGRGIYEIITSEEHRVIVYSIARILSGSVVPTSDISAALWCTRGDLVTMDLTPVVRLVLRDEGWLS